MAQVVYGTAGLAKIPDIVLAGKTGTAQNPHGKDHSVFIAFAPYKNPKIAIAVYVEKCGLWRIGGCTDSQFGNPKIFKRRSS